MALTKVPSNLDSVTATTQSASDNSTNVATTAYVTTAIANLVDGAPSTLNTLNEIAAALNDDAALNTTLTNSIATKLPLAGGTLTGGLGATTITSDVSDGTAITLKRSGGTAARFGVASGPVGFIVLNDTTSNNVAALKGTSAAILPSTNAGADKDGTMSLGSSSVKFKDLHLGGKSFIGSGLIIDDNGTTAAGRLGLNRNPANGAHLSSSSYQRYQINGPGSSGDFLDIQNYDSSGSYQGSLRISGGNAYLNGSNDMRIKLGDSGISGISDSNNTVHIRGDNDSLKLNAAGNGSHIFEVNGVNSYTMTAGGDLQMGQTNAAAIFGTGGGATELYSKSTAGNSGLGIYGENNYNSCGMHLEIATNSNYGWAPMYINRYLGNSGEDSRMIQFHMNGNSDTGKIHYNWANGNFEFDGTSDYRLKSNIVDYTGGLEKINAINVRKFTKNNTDNIVGFVAHELQEVLPVAVSGEKDEVGLIPETGEIGPKYQGVQKAVLIPYLVSAIQEQQDIIEDLKARIETLEG